MGFSPKWVLIVVAALLAVCMASLASAAIRPAVTRDQIMETAGDYATHEWSCSEDNVKHGSVSDKDRIDTPDIDCGNDCGGKGWFQYDGSTNQKVPYKWGGFSTIGEFDDGLSAPTNTRYAGDVCCEGYASVKAVGVDCAGFVSRCWGLEDRYSTKPNSSRPLDKIAYKLSSFSEMKRGDISPLKAVSCDRNGLFPNFSAYKSVLTILLSEWVWIRFD
jgi:hypothetical protein